MTGRDPDRALRAVHRVRTARETDSRLGLARALAEQQRRDQAAATALRRAAAAVPFDAGSTRDFQAWAAHGVRLVTALSAARRSAGSARTVTAEATRHWQHQRAATRVVEMLLARHAQERRADRARVEARELDDIAGRMWLRNRTRVRP